MSENNVDVLLVGGGVMSATLGTMLTQLDPSLKITMVERLDHVAHESTDGWNNAGTGHAGYCELNYTPQNADGGVDIKRALNINAAFEVTLQLLSYLVERNQLPAISSFINPTPHLSFVWGKQDVAFLRERFQLLSKHHLFADMEYSEDPNVLEQWMPLVMHQREASQPVAATCVKYGTDIDFGALTRGMVQGLLANQSFELLLGHPVRSLKQDKKGRWHVRVQDKKNRKSRTIVANFVFLGAGGGALPLLQKSGIPESKGYGGFPVSGQWLVCKNPEIVQQHYTKVYGKAPLGAPPMSVPHLDTRIINGKPALLFGPYAGFTTKFLKKGSFLDLIKSVKKSNLKPIVKVGWSNMDLTRYLIGEAFQTHQQRVKALRNFYPLAKAEDWALANAGQRVQIIKECNEKGGKLEFGTEIVAAQDGSLAALLGASPGASTSVQAMLQVIERCFSSRLQTSEWQAKMKAMVPSYGESLVDDADLLRKVRARTIATLGLARA
ncbi:MAG TPA: malate dehydrogenase (quinone) [Methylophilaceae bacterium]|jgi:malate dehydrogenase (quinone)